MDAATTVLEYPATDKYLWLLLTANGVGAKVKNGSKTISVSASDFDPEVVAGMEDFYLGIPTNIIAVGITPKLDHVGNFSAGTDSFTAERITFEWREDRAESDGPILHRDDGPAIVEYTDFATEHNSIGDRVGFKANSARFYWYQENRMKRQFGPNALIFPNLDILIDDDGTMKTRQPRLSAQLYWEHPKGGDISVDRINRLLESEEVEMNQLSPSETVFPDEAEAMIFYNSV